MKKKRELISGNELSEITAQLSDEVCARIDPANLVLVGIRRRGVELAERIKARLEKDCRRKIPMGILDITLYRDDLSTVSVQPVVGETDIPLDLTDRDILLVDDVLFTGRTIRAALSELIEFGRPRSVKLLVLVDRNNRELPVQPDFTGRFIATERDEIVEVHLKELDGEDRVLLMS